MKEIERWKTEMPREEEMRPKDKYTIFDRKEKRYRKGIHSESTLLQPLVSSAGPMGRRRMKVDLGEQMGSMRPRGRLLMSASMQSSPNGLESASGSTLLASSVAA